MHRSLLLGIVPCLAFAAVVTTEREAHAGPYLGIDVDLGTAFQDKVDLSYGVGGRFGYKVYFVRAPLWILPEVGGKYMNFGDATQIGHSGAAFGGVRFGLDGIVQPNVFSHLGLGFVGDSDLGPYVDVGVGLDFQITRVFSMGIQAAYNSASDPGSPYGAAKWASFGLDFGFDFTRPHRERIVVYTR